MLFVSNLHSSEGKNMVDPIRGIYKFSILLVPRTVKGNALWALAFLSLGIIFGILTFGWFALLMVFPGIAATLHLTLSPKSLEKHNKEWDKYWGNSKTASSIERQANSKTFSPRECQ